MATIAGGLLAFGAIGASSWNTTSPAAQCEALPVYGKPGTNQERTFLAVKPDGKEMEKYMLHISSSCALNLLTILP